MLAILPQWAKLTSAADWLLLGGIVCAFLVLLVCVVAAAEDGGPNDPTDIT